MTRDHRERLISGLRAKSDQYDSFVFDQFGVLHNGTQIYPHVVSVLQELKLAGKTSLVLTNSGRSASDNFSRLGALGLKRELFHDAVTSGDVAVQAVLPDYVARIGPRCFNITSVHHDLRHISAVRNLRLVESLEDCDFVYLSGMSPGLAKTWKQSLLPDLVSTGVPLLCSNPDHVAPGVDELSTSPGTIASAYRDMGGDVQFVGKPHPLIYKSIEQQLALLGCRNPLFVGDSYHHDIVGACRAGFDCLLVLTGIHHDQFQKDGLNGALTDLLTEEAFVPTWVAATL